VGRTVPVAVSQPHRCHRFPASGGTLWETWHSMGIAFHHCVHQPASRSTPIPCRIPPGTIRLRCASGRASRSGSRTGPPCLAVSTMRQNDIPLSAIIPVWHCLFPGFGQQCRPPSGEASSARERGGWRARGCRVRDRGDPLTPAGGRPGDRRVSTRHRSRPAACGRERDEARQGGVSRWRAGSLTVCPSGGSLR
jgi:hypothetical protein